MGSKRGRLISKEKRLFAVKLISEAVESGARVRKACEALEISTSSYERWRAGVLSDSRKGTIKSVPRKFTKEKAQLVVDTCCSSGYKNLNPHKIHASLLNKEIYISPSSTTTLC